MAKEEMKYTQSKIGHMFVPDPYYKNGEAVNVRGHRLFGKWLSHMEHLWKKHGIQVEITNLEVTCTPYISFNTGSVENNAHFAVFVKSVHDELGEQEICSSCNCKGREIAWKAIEAEREAKRQERLKLEQEEIAEQARLAAIIPPAVLAAGDRFSGMDYME